MKKSIVALTAIVLILLSGIAFCSATQDSNESANASISSNVTALFYPTPIPTASTQTPTPTTQTTQTTSTSSGRLTPVDKAQVDNMGTGMKAVVAGAMQIQILYNSVWTMNPTTMYQGSETPLHICTDEYQRIYTKETYPDGHVDTRDWGYYNPGSYMYRFLADAPGTHYLVADGSVTGQSNVLTITVVGGPTPWPPWPPTPTPIPWPPWPPTPTPTPWPPWPPTPTPTPWLATPFTVTAWSASYYYIGNPVYLYYTVNKPCYARVTYLKQNSNIVSCGPYYVAAGTHTDTGTIGYPRGMRIVVVDAWTSSGEYDYAVTSYNVG